MNVIVAGTLFSLVGSLNSLMLSAWISTAFYFLSPYCSRDRASNYSDAFVESFLVCIDGQVVVGEKYFCRI